MKKNNYVYGILIFMLITVFIAGCAPKGKDVYYCPMHPTYISDKPGDCPICNMKLVKKETNTETKDMHAGHMAGMLMPSKEKAPQEICLEHNCTMKGCPMHIVVDMKPGEKISCPVCGDYITTENSKLISASEKKQTNTTVMINPDRQQLIGIKTEPVKVRLLTKTIRASSKIAYDPELVVVQEEFIQALNNQDNIKDSPLKDVIARSTAMTDAARNKLRLMGMSEGQISELSKTRKADTSLYLPDEGESVWAYLAIYEYEIGAVKQGQTVEIEAVAYPGEKFSGKVVSISPVLDATTRTNQVRTKIENPENKLKPEMFVNAKIIIDLGEKLAISEEAVLDTGMRKIVYLSKAEGFLEAKEVKLGQKADGHYEVLEGLKEGDIIVTSGNFFVDSESKLKAAASGASHQHGQ